MRGYLAITSDRGTLADVEGSLIGRTNVWLLISWSGLLELKRSGSLDKSEFADHGWGGSP